MSSCCTAGSTVNPNSTICCCGNCNSGNVSSILNTIGKYGLTLAGNLQGRPVSVGNRGVSVGPSACYQYAVSQSFIPIALIAGVVIVLIVLFKK